MTLLTSILTIYYCYVKRREEKITNLKGEKSLTDHQMPEVTNDANPTEMETMIGTNRTELVLERQMSKMNEYSTDGSDMTLEWQTSTIKEGDPSKINEDTFLNDQATLLPYTGKCEIDRTKFEVNQLLGGGQFGSVFEGITNDLVHPEQRIKVAIKVVNNPLDVSQLNVLMSEIKILDKLDVHLNLVNMIGACTTQLKEGKLWLLLEYCPQSDLKRFLLKNREAILHDLKPKTTSDEFERVFIKWGHGIAKGLEYLFSKRIMHGDLAARNILIGMHGETENRYVVKITDFGLSRAFYECSTYTKQDREKIPWKWMDIYFLETGTFTMNSDVWSFGILLWEMFSLGRSPYAGANARDTISEINSGYRLPVPVEISQVKLLAKIYEEVVNKCLLLDPKKRWTFTDLVDYFEAYLTPEEKDDYKRLEEQYVKMQNVITAKSKTSN